MATLTLNRPDSLNALNGPMRRELLAALKAVGRDPEVRCVVITGAGRGFCSGADLRGGDAERQFRRVLRDEYNPVMAAVRDLPKPVLAAVNGVAAGAGVSLALACDLVYAADEARFIQAFIRIGLVPDSGSTRTLVRAPGPPSRGGADLHRRPAVGGRGPRGGAGGGGRSRGRTGDGRRGGRRASWPRPQRWPSVTPSAC